MNEFLTLHAEILSWIVICLLALITTVIFSSLYLQARLHSAQKLLTALEQVRARNYQSKLLNSVKKKIVFTQQNWDKRITSEDIIAKYLYQRNDIQQLGTELAELHEVQYHEIRTVYPMLTDLDMLFLSLLSIDMDNVEISNILQMEKKTLYRRRQLIARRIGISSTELETFAKNNLNIENIPI